jgi:hypothetical protein
MDALPNPCAEGDLLIEQILSGARGDLVVVHAGVVICGETAIVLPGPSHSGKTTLVCELLSCGADYSSDEYALIDAAGYVHPWPRGLMLRDSKMGRRAVLAADLGAKVRTSPARAGLMLFLEYRRGAGFETSPMTQSESLLGLLRNTPHALAGRPAILQPLASLARASQAFQGVRGDASDAAARLLAMARQG